ncbi:MAG: 16S rRNA (cytidine(1402)-2'-O)-methyltransferase [Bacteroidia bacterium]
MAKLYLVPTPIGNLEDITLRAIRVLKDVRLILAEDTRSTSVLLNRYEIKVPAIPYHQHNEHHLTPQIVERIAGGEDIAIVTDAGTPGISDPGFLLARACIAAGVEVECLPGATAFVPALVDSGIPCNSFCFEGFLPPKKGRNTKLEELKNEPRTMVFYESPYRLLKTLEQFCEVFGGGRKASVSRELTKIHEETVRGTLAELTGHFKDKNIKGEIVIIVSGKED